MSTSAEKWGSVATKLNDMHMNHTIGFKEGSVLQVGGVDERLTKGMAEGIKTALKDYVVDIVKEKIAEENKKKIR